MQMISGRSAANPAMEIRERPDHHLYTDEMQGDVRAGWRKRFPDRSLSPTPTSDCAETPTDEIPAVT